MTVSGADRSVLSQLKEHGDHPAVPRPVMHFFYGDRAELYDVAERLERPGWQEVELARGADDFRLVATKITDLLDNSVSEMMADVEQALSGLNVTYDGWETSIEKPN
ncbi:hypothetical protein GCM10011380_24960 [Sphingomonas metalli]|uniref:Regulator of ribonuclease activity B domain-containing protein n=1 Tax=Sphingomonas metalli TaxID=1779358 RepID=A0A916WW23_9SPHN|nr:ribonuclease E inhibitor RraB [Sphingomonas metalli]GGB34503.1 hypothetical protein GCM10011380_24960 [Sphingomonas metalli]